MSAPRAPYNSRVIGTCWYKTLLDLLQLFSRSTPFRRLVAAIGAAMLLALLFGTIGNAIPAALDGLLADITQRADNRQIDTVRVVTLPGGASGTSLSRAELARLHEHLVAAGALAVVLQVPLDTPQAARDLAQVQGMLDAVGASQDPALQTRLRNWAQELDHDARLELALRRSGHAVLVAPEQVPSPAGEPSTPLTALPALNSIDAPALPPVAGPLARFSQVAVSATLSPAHIDADGIRRHEALYFETPDGAVPSVALAAWLVAHGMKPEQLSGGESAVNAGTQQLLLAGDATWLPRYGAATALHRSSANQWISPTAAPDDVRGRVVVVCPHMPLEATPAGRRLSQCDGTALRIASLMAGDYLLEPLWTRLLVLLLWAAVIAFAALVAPTLPTVGRIAAGSGLAVGIIGLELWLLSEHNTVVQLMPVVIALAALLPWVWRLRIPERTIAESLLASEGAHFPTRVRSKADLARGSANGYSSQTTPLPVPARPSTLTAAEAATASRLGLDAPTNTTDPVATAVIPRPPVPPSAVPAKATTLTGSRNLKALPIPAAAAGHTSLRELSNQLSSRMLDPSTADVADLLLGRIKRPEKPKLGRYELDREAGRGAMGTVYVGRDPQINRVVAIKAIPLSDEANESDASELKARFFREAEMAGRLAHPRIVTVFDAGEDRGIAYIAMEFVQGQTLSDFTNSDRRLPDAEVLEVIARVAEGLDYAHTQGVVHRDIKPGNIIYNPSTGVTKITDFGIARVTNSASTRTGIVLGTPSFMSPEQLEGKKLKGTSDLFSLGITLFQLLTGQLPFRADSMTALMDKIANSPHPPLETLRPDLPPAAALIIDHALEKDPAHRFQTGVEMASALRHCAAVLGAGQTAAFEIGVNDD